VGVTRLEDRISKAEWPSLYVPQRREERIVEIYLEEKQCLRINGYLALLTISSYLERLVLSA